KKAYWSSFMHGICSLVVGPLGLWHPAPALCVASALRVQCLPYHQAESSEAIRRHRLSNVRGRPYSAETHQRCIEWQSDGRCLKTWIDSWIPVNAGGQSVGKLSQVGESQRAFMT